MTMAKATFQLVLTFMAVIVANALFQTVCQNIWSVQVDGTTKCVATQSLNGYVYMAILVILTLMIFSAIKRRKAGEVSRG